MLSTQEKVDQIHSILVKMESRYRRRIIFSWFIRIVMLVIILFIAMNPGFVLQKVSDFMFPILEKQIEEIVEKQKEKMIDSGQNLLESMKNLGSK